ncbi:hypothetical protein E4U44_007675 [Claviceps purpurea]|nr:hypothetical protein E4U44_007675 [Claviceps purpurea]
MTSAGKEATRRPPAQAPFLNRLPPQQQGSPSRSPSAFSLQRNIFRCMEPAPGNRPAQIEEKPFCLWVVPMPDGEEREEAETRRKADFFREMAMDGLWGGIGGKARVG